MRAGDWFIESAAMHELQQCVFRGGKRVRVAVHKRTEREFSNFLDFIHVCQLSNQTAQIAPAS